MKQLVLPPGALTGDQVVLTGKEHHYLARVRRAAVGERLFSLDGGVQLTLEVTEVSHDRTHLRVVGSQDILATGPRLTLFPFLLKARKLDDVVRQACEAGAAEIVPVVGDHCVSRPDSAGDGANKSSRWQTIAKEAAQQSGNSSVCRVHPPGTLKQALEWWSDRGPLLFFHQVPLDKGSLHRYLFSRPESVGLIVGPEGGLSDPEVRFCQDHGALPVWLGPFVLRAETASLYAIAAVNTILQETPEWTIPESTI